MSERPPLARQFRFRAIGADGAPVAGRIAAASRDAALEALRRQGSLPLALSPARLAAVSVARRGLSVRRSGAFLAALALLLQNGVALDTALGLLADPAGDAATARLAGRLRTAVRDGAGLAGAIEATERDFDPAALAMIRAGEEAGQLAQAIAAAAAQLEARRQAAAKLAAALAYPAMVCAAAVLSLALIAGIVAPAFLPMFADRGAAPPAALALLAAVGGFVAEWWAALLLAALGLWLLARALLAQPELRLARDRRLLALPWLGRLLAAAEVARFTLALGGMLQAGVRLPQALKLSRQVLGNAALAAEIAAATSAVRAGDRLAAALGAVAALPPVARQLLAVGEQSAQVAPVLLRIAALCQHQVEREVARALALLGPGLVIGLGALVAFVIAALLGAVLDANQLVL
jgi:general secretion pathway protein F